MTDGPGPGTSIVALLALLLTTPVLAGPVGEDGVQAASQHAPAAALLAGLEAAEPGDTTQLLATARVAQEHRRHLVGTMLSPSLDPLLAQQQRSVDAIGELLALLEDGQDDDLDLAVTLAKRVSQVHATTQGVAWPAPGPLGGHEAPSQALLQLADRYGVDPTPVQRADIEGLDTLPRPQRAALARAVDAFLVLDAAAHEAFARLDPSRLPDLQQPEAALESAWADASAPRQGLQGAGVELGPVLAARAQFLEATVDLQEALATSESDGVPPCGPVTLLPAFAIDVSRCDDTYVDDVALLLDLGGNDTYRNNAGGSGVLAADQATIFPGRPCNIFEFSQTNVQYPARAAALVDLDGQDRYGDASARRSCGVNGGGNGGVGLLVDAAGDDVYAAGSLGVNGGGGIGVGLLVDVLGNDTYTAGSTGANGGGSIGMGSLLDISGEDTYAGVIEGTNGGGYLGGSGFLLDATGDDIYDAFSRGVNGGGSIGGTGHLLDAGGDDRYDATGSAANGGGALAAGLLVDILGNDIYTAGSSATNGGGTFGGAGALLDGQGDDTYTAGSDGTNGGGIFGGAGLLLDGQGDDGYEAGACAVNGGGVEETCTPFNLGDLHVPGTGLLLDPLGTDSYADAVITSCTDCSWVPKGTTGAQVDGTHPEHIPDRVLEEASRCEDKVPRPPILIRGDPMFRLGPAVGVLNPAAAGTAEDPFLIEGWCVLPPANHDRARTSGLLLWETSAHVVILDNVIDGTPPGPPGRTQDSGILLLSSRNVTVEGNKILGNEGDGIRLSGGEAIRVENNTITGNDGGAFGGVVLFGPSGVRIANNTITGNQPDGVSIWDSQTVDVVDNVLADNQRYGVFVRISSGVQMAHNNLQGNNHGLHVRGGSNPWSFSTPVDAWDNWWGDPTGPGGGITDACTREVADGSGQSISLHAGGEVCFEPWLTAPNPEAGVS